MRLEPYESTPTSTRKHQIAKKHSKVNSWIMFLVCTDIHTLPVNPNSRRLHLIRNKSILRSTWKKGISWREIRRRKGRGHLQVEQTQGVVVGAGEEAGTVGRPLDPFQEVSARVWAVPELTTEVVEPARDLIEPKHWPLAAPRRFPLDLFFYSRFYFSFLLRNRRQLLEARSLQRQSHGASARGTEILKRKEKTLISKESHRLLSRTDKRREKKIQRENKRQKKYKYIYIFLKTRRK